MFQTSSSGMWYLMSIQPAAFQTEHRPQIVQEAGDVAQSMSLPLTILP